MRKLALFILTFASICQEYAMNTNTNAEPISVPKIFPRVVVVVAIVVYEKQIVLQYFQNSVPQPTPYSVSFQYLIHFGHHIPLKYEILTGLGSSGLRCRDIWHSHQNPSRWTSCAHSSQQTTAFSSAYKQSQIWSRQDAQAQAQAFK